MSMRDDQHIDRRHIPGMIMLSARECRDQSGHRPGMVTKYRIDQYITLPGFDQQGRMPEPNQCWRRSGQCLQIGFNPWQRGSRPDGFKAMAQKEPPVMPACRISKLCQIFETAIFVIG